MRSFYYYLIVTGLVVASLKAFGGSDEGRDVNVVDNSIVIDRIVNGDIEVIVPSVIFAFKETKIKLKFKNPEHTKLLLNNNKLHFIINGEDTELLFTNGEASFNRKFNDANTLSIYVEEFSFTKKINAYPLWGVLLVIGTMLFLLLRRVMKRKPKTIHFF